MQMPHKPDSHHDKLYEMMREDDLRFRLWSMPPPGGSKSDEDFYDQVSMVRDWGDPRDVPVDFRENYRLTPEAVKAIERTQREVEIDDRSSIRTDILRPSECTPEWIVKNMLVKGEITMLVGEGGVGKTRLALQLAHSIAVGDTDLIDNAIWLHHSDKPRYSKFIRQSSRGQRVLYVSLEDDHARFSRRLHKINPRIEERGMQAEYEHRFGQTYIGGLGPLWGVPEGIHAAVNLAQWTRLGKRAIASSIGAFDEHGVTLEPATLVIFDTLSYAFDDDENKRSAVSKFCGALAYFSRRYGFASLVLAHPAKAKDSIYSGSTAWWGNARGLWWMGYREETYKQEVNQAGRGGAPVVKEIKKKAHVLALVNEKSNDADIPLPMAHYIKSEGGGRFEMINRSRAIEEFKQRVGEDDIPVNNDVDEEMYNRLKDASPARGGDYEEEAGGDEDAPETPVKASKFAPSKGRIEKVNIKGLGG